MPALCIGDSTWRWGEEEGESGPLYTYMEEGEKGELKWSFLILSSNRHFFQEANLLGGKRRK